MEEIITLFPNPLCHALSTYIKRMKNPIEEIRLRIGQDIEIVHQNGYQFLENMPVNSRHIDYVLAQMTQHSLYRYEQQIKAGFITIDGGHRVGIAGQIVLKNGEIHHMANIAFMNIRIAKACRYEHEHIIQYLYEGQDWKSVCIVGAPQTGKTTLLRSLAKSVSDGTNKRSSKKVFIVDERSEITNMAKGHATFSVGRRTDILDNCPKHIGMMIGIRTMSPHVIIVDEIGSKQDVQAIHEAIYSGVQIMCTIHAGRLTDVMHKKIMHPIIADKSFERYVELKRANNRIHVTIYNEDLHVIGREKMVME